MSRAWKDWQRQIINGEFPLRQYLGESGHGAVFLTEGQQEPQKAAIKLIPADPARAEAQLSGWQQAAELSHPNLLRIFQAGRCQVEDSDLLFVVTEYAEEDLSQVLPQRPLTPAEARDMLEPLLDALAYLHGEGFVHGHVKPANIMAIDDVVKLSSDGVCPIDEPPGGLRASGDYDPPEAANGMALPAGDVWSLGITLVEVLTQRRPPWDQAKQAEPELPQTLPAPFLELVRNCLRRDPQQRWTIPQISAWLEEPAPPPATQEPVTLRPATTAPPKPAPSPYTVPFVLVSLALAVLFLGPLVFNRTAKVQPAPAIAPAQPQAQPKAPSKPAAQDPTPPKKRSTPEAGGSKQNDSAAPAPSPRKIEEQPKTPKSGVAPGEVFQKILPEVPQKASDTIRGTVRVSVRVAVNTSGKVEEATLDSPGPSQYFANLALQAARRWEFWAPKVDGQSVRSEWILRFQFTQAATGASATQVDP